MFNKLIHDFNENIIGLRDFVDLIDPILTENYDKQWKQLLNLFLVGFLKNMSRNKDFETLVTEKLEDLRINADPKVLDLYNSIIDVNIVTESESESENRILGKEEIASLLEFKNTFSLIYKTNGSDNFSKYFNNAGKANKHIEVLYMNALISLISSVEWFFSQILHNYYEEQPESASINKKTLTLSQLKDFDSEVV